MVEYKIRLDDEEDNYKDSPNVHICPDCGAKLVPESGCIYCPFCGYSECH